MPTASEKLRALEGERWPDPDFSEEQGRKAWAAIVDVIAAAENGCWQEAEDGSGEDFTTCICCNAVTWRGHKSDCPLIALQEALDVNG